MVYVTAFALISSLKVLELLIKTLLDYFILLIVRMMILLKKNQIESTIMDTFVV